MAIALESGRQWLHGAAGHASRVGANAPAPPRGHRCLRQHDTHRHRKTCLDMLQLAERCVGARSLLQPLPFERLHRDLTRYLR